MRYKQDPYEDRSIGTIAELMLRSGQLQSDQQERLAAIAAKAELERGEAAARALQARGQAWGQGLGTVAQIAGAIPGMVEANKRTKLAEQEIGLRSQKLGLEVDEANRLQADRRALDLAQEPIGFDPDTSPESGTFRPGVDTGPPEAQRPRTREEIRAAVPGHLQAGLDDIWQKADTGRLALQQAQMNYDKDRREAFGRMAAPVAVNGYKMEDYLLAVDAAEAAGYITPQQKLERKQRVQDRPDQVKPATDEIIALSKEGSELLEKAKPKWQVGTPGGTLYNPEDGTTGATLPKDPTQTNPTEASLALLAAKGGPEGAQAQAALRILKAQRPASSGGGVSATELADVKTTIGGMKAGTLPPLLPGRASTLYTAMMAEAVRQNYDLAGAVTDWMATQKHIATMNGSQQLRLNQAINALPELFDSVQTLADKWDAGRFAVLNKANMMAAINGAYGNEAAALATALKTQISDVVSDLGVVYMGGNSPTDHALKLAETALNENWSREVLTKMVALGKSNAQIRKNSINNTGVQGASAENPYAPAPGGGYTAPPPAPAAAAGTPPAVGSIVTFEGRRYRVKSITNNAAQLEPAP